MNRRSPKTSFPGAICIAACIATQGCAPTEYAKLPSAVTSKALADASSSVGVLAWQGVRADIRRGTIGAFLANGEFRTVRHTLEIHPGSGFFLATLNKAFVNGQQVEWQEAVAGNYQSFRKGASSEDWVHLRLTPDPQIPGLPFDPDFRLEPGARVYVLGFDQVVSGIGEDMIFRGNARVIPATIVPIPPRRFRDSDDTTGLAYLRPDAKGIQPGWSGAPVVATDDEGKPRVVGSLISVYTGKGTPEDPEAPNLDDIQYVTFVRNGPRVDSKGN